MADNSWLTALPVSGSGDLSVSVGGTLWTGRLDRSGQLTVSGVTYPALSCVLNCTQAGSVILESTGESSATVGALVEGYVALQGVSIRSNLESLTFSFVGSDGDSDWVSGIQYSVDGGDTMLDSGESIPGDPGAAGAYTVGVYVSVAEETSGVSRSGVLTVSGSGQRLEFTISQSAGVKTYGPVEILSLTAADVPASGGSVLSGSVSYRQTYGWNGATSGAGTITSGGSVSWSGGASGIGSLGTTVKDRSVVGSPLVVTVALNDQVGSSSVDIYQAANVSTLTGISADTLSYDAIPVLGGSSSPYYSISGSYSYTSGSTSTSVIDSVVRSRMRAATAATKSFAFVAPVTGFTIDSGTGVISATETEQSSEKVAQVKMSVEYGGFSSSVTGTCLQPAGSVVYGTPTVVLSYATAPAAGGTLRPVFSVTQPWGWNNDTDAGVLSYDLESLPDGSSVNFTTTAGTVGSKDGSITVPTKGTTESGVTTYATITCAVNVNGVSGSGTAAVSQAANTKALTDVSIERNGDGAIVTSFTAAGGTAYYKPVGVYTYTSTSTQTVELDSEVTKDNWSLDQAWGSVAANPTYPWCSVVTINSRGTTIGNSQSAVLKLTVGGLSDSVTLTQAGNYVTGLTILDGSMSYPTISAGATSATPSIVAPYVKFTFSSGSVTSNKPDTAYGSYNASVKYSLGSVQNGFSAVNENSGILTATNRGTEIGNARTSGVVTRTTYATWTPTSAYNVAGVIPATKNLTATCKQVGNYVVDLLFSGGTFNYPDINAGATSTSPGTVVDKTITYKFSSGATSTTMPSSTYGSLSRSITYSLGSVQNGFTSVNSSTGVLTATNRGTTIGEARTSGVVTRTTVCTWKHTTNYGTGGTLVRNTTQTATCTQAANTLTWNTPTISRTTPVSMPVGGGSNNVATGLTYSQTGKYSSGSPASASSGGSLSYAVQTAKSGYSLSGSTVTVTNNTSTSARNGFVVRITLKLNGKTATKDITYNQIAGYYTYANPVVSVSYSTIPASGGTVTPTVSYSQTYGWNGATSGVGTKTSGGTVSYSGTSVNTSNGSVTAGSKGATASGVTKVTDATVTVDMNGKRGTKTVGVNQAANSIVKYNYGNYTASLSSNSTAALAAGADKRTITWGYIWRSRTPVYSSGDLGSASTETWSGTAYLTISVNSGTSYCSVSPSSYTNSSSTTSSTLTKTTYGTTVISAQTYTLQVRQGSTSGTVVASILVTSKANAVTNSNYNPRITAYGTPTVSIGSGMTAAGGSATVSHSVTNTQTYNALYTSGATGPDQTRSVAGTSTISITSNGNNAFSLSGNTLSHRDMATTLATDSVTITAKNSGDTSKTKTASTSITNTRKATSTSGGATTYGNVTAGTITNKTIPASGGSATATAGNGSQSWSKTAVVTTYKYDSGDTKQETTTPASSGSTPISPSVSSITAEASSKGQTVSGQTTVKTQAVTWSGSAGKSASGTMYIYQAANSLKSYSNVLINQFSYNNIPYSGGSVSPVIDVTYDVTYDSGTYYDEHGLPPGYSITYATSGSWFTLNTSTGVITAPNNTTTDIKSVIVTANLYRNSDHVLITSTKTTIKQDAKPGPVDIYITTSFNYGNSTIQLNFSIAPKDTFFIKFMGYDQFGGIWEYTTGIVPSSSTSFQISVPGYNITDQFSIEGLGPTEYTISPTSPYETTNAMYYWSSEMITEV